MSVKDILPDLKYYFLQIRGFFYFSHRDWLSERVETEYKKIFKESASSFVRKRGLFRTFIESMTLWFFLIPILLAIVFILLIQRFPLLQIWLLVTTERIDITVTNLLSVPLALVGLVIPLLVLVVSIVVGRISSSLVRHYFRIQRPQTIIYLALFVLASDILFLSAKRFLIVMPESIQHSAVLFLILCSLELILLAGFTVRKAIESMDPSIVFEITQKVLKELVGKSFIAEIKRNIGWNILDSECEKLGIKASFMGLSGRNFLRSKKRGVISNINLKGLGLINSQLLERDKPVYLQIRRNSELLNDDDDRIASFEGQLENGQINIITHWLDRCYRVKPLPDKDELRDTLDEFKTLTVEFCRVGDERKLRSAFDTYSEILKEYLRLGIRIPIDQQFSILDEWQPLRIIFFDLQDIIESTVQSKNRNLIANVTYSLKELMLEAMQQKDGYLFSRIAKLFPIMYYSANREKSLVGIHRSYFELMQIFDFNLFRSIDEKKEISLEETKFKVEIAFIIYETLHQILRGVIDQNDIETFKKLSKKLTPEEFLAHHHISYKVTPGEDRRELRQKQEGTQEYVKLKEKLEAIELIEDIPRDYKVFNKNSIFSALGYLFDHYENQRKTQNEIEPFVAFMWRQIDSVKTLVDFIEKGNGETAQTENIWRYYEDTRQVTSTDPIYLPLLVFCLYGLSIQIVKEQVIEIPPSRVLDGRYQQIEAVASNILKNIDKWKWLIGIISEGTLIKFLEGVKKSAEKYQENVAQSIKVAPLSQEKIIAFKEEVLKAYKKNVELRPFLERKKILIETAKFEKPVSEPKHIGIYVRVPKEVFIDQDRVHWIGSGENFSGNIARGEDFHIVKSIYSNPEMPSLPLKGDQKLHELLNQAVAYLKPKYKPDIIIVPILANVPFSLINSPKFSEPSRTFDEISIIEYYPENGNIVLVGDVLSALEIVEFSKLKIDVRLLNDTDKESILKTEPGLKLDKLDEEIIVDISESFRTIIKNPQAFVKFALPVELAE